MPSGDDHPRWVDAALQEPNLDRALDRGAARGGTELAVDRECLALDRVARDDSLLAISG